MIRKNVPKRLTDLVSERREVEKREKVARTEYEAARTQYLNDLLEPYNSHNNFSAFQHLPEVDTEFNEKEFPLDNLGKMKMIVHPSFGGRTLKYGYAKGNDWQAVAFNSTETSSYFLLVIDNDEQLIIYENTGTIGPKYALKNDEMIRGVFDDGLHGPFWSSEEGYSIEGLAMLIGEREESYDAFVNGFETLVKALDRVADDIVGEIELIKDQTQTYQEKTTSLQEG